jgi:hypothetical protein
MIHETIDYGFVVTDKRDKEGRRGNCNCWNRVQYDQEGFRQDRKSLDESTPHPMAQGNESSEVMQGHV